MARAVASCLLGLVLGTVALGASARAQEHVLVQRSAAFHARPDASADNARDTWAAHHDLRLGPFWVMRYVGEQSGWVEVASMPGFRAGDHCYATPSGLDGLDVHLFVRADAVAPVVGQGVTRSFGDTASVRLVSGVGLTPRGRNRYDAWVRGAQLRVELSPDEVSARYRVSERIAVARSSIALLAPGAEVDLGRSGGRITTEAGERNRAAQAPRGTITFDASETGGRSADGPARAQLAVEADTTTGPRILATVRTSCLEARGYVRGRDLTTDRPARPVTELGGHRGTTIQPGAIVYWPDGARAGRVAAAVSLDGASQASGDRVCFEQPLRANASTQRATNGESLTMCFDRAAVIRPTRPRAFRR